MVEVIRGGLLIGGFGFRLCVIKRILSNVGWFVVDDVWLGVDLWLIMFVL